MNRRAPVPDTSALGRGQRASCPLVVVALLLTAMTARSAEQDVPDEPPPDAPPPVEAAATPIPAHTERMLERKLTVMTRRASGESLLPLAAVQVRVAGSNAATEQTDEAGTVRLAIASDTALTLQLFVASKPTCKLAVPGLRDIDVALRIELWFETVADKRLCKATRLPVTTPELVTH